MRTAVTIGSVSALIVGLAGTALASSLSLDSAQLAAGGAVVGRCDDTVTFAYNVVPGPAGGPANVVDSVDLVDVASACSGGSVGLTLTGSTGAVLSSVRSSLAVATSGRATVVLAIKPDAADVKAIYVVVQR